MNFTFSFRNKYTVNRSVEDLKSVIQTVSNKKWHDFSENLSAELIGKRRFEFTPKWSFGTLKVGGMHQDFTYVFGTLTEDNGQTVISMNSRPNNALVIIFYIVLFLPVGKWFNLELLEELSFANTLIVSSIFVPVLAGLMIMQTLSLRSKVERLLGLSRK
ncbi:hypothetical protein SAMN05661096_04142 [Marivirga sericea]|uniref:Uncharacterized protein n=1 Tax=Marivirga sericea TaxID=1028 RepID=A0A1X7LMN3_9BACT|nr:hypothetical protein [Marivirga sericea]SMG54502.1 hypothetical protein SAMN05661096_04142 [Marivirga sericea]